MNNVGIFLNSRIVGRNSFDMSDVSVAFGNWCLTPVRCLFNGHKVTFSDKNDSLTVEHENEYAIGRYDWEKPKKNYLRVAASIALIIPGLIVGCVFKGLGYLSQSIRERHHIAIQHYTPVNIILGTPEARCNLDEIKRALAANKQTNNLNQPAKNIIIYAEDGTAINEDPGFVSLMPEKVILVGARIVHQPSATGRLDEALLRKSGWECNVVRHVHDDMSADNTTFVTQWKMKSVAAALQDTPPKLSQFSSKRYNRIYLV